MITSIRSMNRDIEFNLELKNDLSRLVYKANSINLIIGNNGSGKTNVIHSIIEDALSAEPSNFSIRGATDNLGIIYYTGTPFSRPLKGRHKSTVSFINATNALEKGGNYLTCAHEYLMGADALGVTDRIQSEFVCDLEELAEKMVVRTTNSSSFGRNQSVLLGDGFRELSEYADEYKRLDRNRRAIQTDIRKYSNDYLLNGETPPASAYELEKIELELERIIESQSSVRKRIANIVLSEIGPKSHEDCITWVAYRTLFKTGVPLSAQRIVAAAIFQKDFSELKSGPYSKLWNSHWMAVAKFVDMLHATQTGTFEFNEEQIRLGFDVRSIIQANIDPNVLENAYRIGILKLAFQHLSSGEAALLHQLSCLSHALHELERRGRKNALIFIDEGDMLLHMEWQHKYLELVDKRLAHARDALGFDSLQIVLATHSPLLASDCLKGSVVRVGAGKQIKGFGAPLQEIVNYSFNTPAIGAIAERVIKDLNKKNIFSEDDRLIINDIDNEFIRRHLLKNDKNP